MANLHSGAKVFLEALALGLVNALLQCGIWLVTLYAAPAGVQFGAGHEAGAYAFLFGGFVFWPLLWFVVTFVWVLLARFLLEVDEGTVLVGVPLGVASCLSMILLVLAARGR